MQTKKPFNRIFISLILLIAASVFGAVFLLFHLNTPSAVESPAVRSSATGPEITGSLQIQSSLTAAASVQKEIPEIEPSPTSTQETIGAIDFFRSNITRESYAAWIRKISGAEPVSIGGQEYTIETRYSYAMFTGQQNAKAKEFLLETLKQWVPETQIAVEPYTYTDATSTNTWYNIVITFRGETVPDEQVLFTAHYDSCVVFEGDPMSYAPGANDNGTGVATILEAVRIFSQMKFDRTVKVILFSGEENFQQGSHAYVAQHSSDHIIGVINMDMYGTDKDNDRCFELYVGKLDGSRQLADFFIQTINDNNLNLKYDYLTGNAYALADQAAFWEENIPAVTAMENFLPETSEGGCIVQDRTDFWHLPGDTIEAINLSYAFDIGLAGTITVLNLTGAHPVVVGE
ncbi:MAG: M28 family metallopeptidase [Flexilinea sp.]